MVTKRAGKRDFSGVDPECEASLDRLESTRPDTAPADDQVYRERGWEPSQSGMRQPSAADLAEQPLTPAMQVTTARLDHLELLVHASFIDYFCC
jgi:hypothetical protein